MKFPTDANEYKFVYGTELDEDDFETLFRFDNLKEFVSCFEFHFDYDYDDYLQGYFSRYYFDEEVMGMNINSIKDIEEILKDVTYVTKNGENIDKEEIIEAIWEKFNEMKSKDLEYEIKKLDTKRLALEKQLNSITKEIQMQTIEKDNNNVVKVNKERE